MRRPNSELAQILTQEEIALLAQCFGAGRMLFIPSSTANAAHLEIILGLPATSILVHRLGGNYIYIPGLPRPTGHPREPSLHAVKAANGKSAATLAREFKTSVRTIYAKRAEIRKRERKGLGLDAPPIRKAVRCKKTRARERKGIRPQERASLRRSVQRDLADD